MRIFLNCVATIFCAGFYCIQAEAQQPQQQDRSANNTEFITSSSPLPDGSVVTTTYFPKSGARPQTTVTQGLPASQTAWPPTIGSGIGNERSVLQSLPQTNTSTWPAIASRPLIETAQLPSSPAVVNVQPVNPTINVPTWGNPFAGPRRYLPANYQPAIANPNGSMVTTGYLPTGTVYPYPVASTVPTLNGPSALPSTGYAPDPRVSYQPIFKLQNMPPGTYLGQGWLGQPTAYVDGQPIRNLFRYILP